MPGQPGEAIAAFAIHAGKEPDALLAASNPSAAAVRVIGPEGKLASRLAIRPGEELTLGPKGPHLRLNGIRCPLTPGRELLLQLSFERADMLAGSATVPRTQGRP